MNDNDYSREEYEKTIAYARRNRYWAMLNAIVEDGYDSKVNWKALRIGETNEEVAAPISAERTKG